MKFTPTQRAILLDRLELDVIADVFADTEEMNVTKEEAQKAVDFVTDLVQKNSDFNINNLSKLQLEVLADCLDGSTYFADSEYAVALGNLTKGKLNHHHKAADQLEEIISQAIGRKILCVRF